MTENATEKTAPEGFYYPASPYPADECDYDGLDIGIREYVRVLRQAGIQTYESCDGSEGHAYTQPTIRFFGQQDEGWRALSVALSHALPVSKLSRIWVIRDGEPIGPDWEMVFYRRDED